MEEQQHLLKHNILLGDNWLALNEVMDIFKLFYDLIKRAEGTKLSRERGVLSNYIITLNILLDHVRGIRDDLNARADDDSYLTPLIRYLRAYIVNY